MAIEQAGSHLMRARWSVGVGLFVWLAVGAMACFIASSSLQELPLLAKFLEPFRDYIPGEKALYSPLAYFCLLSLVAILEYRIPAQAQPIISTSLIHDMFWYTTTMVFRLTFLGLYAGLLYRLYHNHLSFLDVESAASWHPLTRFVVAILVGDFMRWLAHLIIHKVPLFWEFHAVHHSQQRLNLFTDARVHPVDHMISATIKFIPLFMFDNSLPYIMAWAIFETIYPKFYHANVRLSFGPLRYILVTPQSHRLHHAAAPEYRDRNFGFTFSIWDRLFGTQFEDHTVYPATGIADSHFPQERGAGPGSLVSDFIQQLIYPFRRIGRSGRNL